MDYSIYSTIKAIHIIFVVSWFAGLFYIVRLFIYHSEALKKNGMERGILAKEYGRIEKLLWKIITVPALYGTLLTGILMLFFNPFYLQQDWMKVKLFMVFILLVYQFVCGKIMNNLKNNRIVIDSFKLRLWNEVATILLVIIVFLAVKKNSFTWVSGVGILIFSLFILSAVNLSKIIRDKKKKNN